MIQLKANAAIKKEQTQNLRSTFGGQSTNHEKAIQEKILFGKPNKTQFLGLLFAHHNRIIRALSIVVSFGNSPKYFGRGIRPAVDGKVS